jgi:hypothetical protein
VIYGSCHVLTDAAYFDLRSEVANKFHIHPNEVLVVGSSKLGFSIAPTKRYRHFADSSDIDVVIVSRGLFDRMWKAVHTFWDQGGYWEGSREFKDYLFRGWIRPDKLPSAKSFSLANDWWEFFNALSSTGKYSMYKIRGALYMDWYFLEAYQLRGVSACLDHLRDEQAKGLFPSFPEARVVASTAG